MPLGLSIDNNPEDRKWFSFGTGDVTTSGGGFRAQATEDDDEKKKLAFIDFNATGKDFTLTNNIWSQGSNVT